MLRLLVKRLKNFKTRGFVADGLECVAGKLFDGSWSSLKITTNVSKQTAEILATRDRNTTYIDNMYSQGNEVGLGAFNWLQDKGIKLGYKDKNKFLVGMFGSPTKKSTMVAFEGPLGIKVIGSAANMTDFVAHSKKSLGIFGETKLVSLANMGKVKNYKLENMLGVLPVLKVFTKETGAGLFLPQLSDEKKEKDEYKYSIVVTKETKDQIQENYSKVLNPNEMLSDKGIKSLISNSHGTYTMEI